MADGKALRAGLRSFDERGAFSEDDYLALKRTVEAVGLGKGSADVLDGFVSLFFERHVLDDVRRRELLAMSDDELVRAVRHRFRQVVAGAQDSWQEWHALSAHVRDALASLDRPGAGDFPHSLRGKGGFSAILVEQAVGALWTELGRKPTSSEATAELLSRYREAGEPGTASREVPAVMRVRLDAQRLARGILAVLSDDEKDLLRQALDGKSLDDWSRERGVSRATAYRMLSRIKSLCRVEFDQRSTGTQLDVLDVIREHL